MSLELLSNSELKKLYKNTELDLSKEQTYTERQNSLCYAWFISLELDYRFLKRPSWCF